MLSQLLLSLSCSTPASPQPPGQFGSWKQAVSAASNACPPSSSTGNHTGADGWEKTRENRKEVNQIHTWRGEEGWHQCPRVWTIKVGFAGMKRSELGDEDYSMPACLNSICHHCLSQFLGLFFILRLCLTQSPVVWKAHSSLSAKPSASFEDLLVSDSLGKVISAYRLFLGITLGFTAKSPYNSCSTKDAFQQQWAAQFEPNTKSRIVDEFPKTVHN